PHANEALADEYKRRAPVWRFCKHARPPCPFAWTSMTADHLPRVFDALAGYEGMTWGDILQQSKHRHCHPMPVDELHKEVAEHLAQQGHDIDPLFQMGTGNRGRIYGARVDHVFEIIFWDPEHKIYVTKKKNT